MNMVHTTVENETNREYCNELYWMEAGRPRPVLGVARKLSYRAPACRGRILASMNPHIAKPTGGHGAYGSTSTA